MRRRSTERRLAPALAGALAALVLCVPRAAEACYVCFGGSDSAWPAAFRAGILVLLFLPPAIVGGAAFAIYRSIKRIERERTAAQPTPAEQRTGAAGTAREPALPTRAGA